MVLFSFSYRGLSDQITHGTLGFTSMFIDSDVIFVTSQIENWLMFEVGDLIVTVSG